MIIIKHRGTFAKTDAFLKRASSFNVRPILEKYGQMGVDALSNNTPVDTGATANAWGYTIVKTRTSYVINWTNTNVVKGVPIALVIQYGHATRNGGYVYGRDYINPAIQPIFEKLANEAWREVTR